MDKISILTSILGSYNRSNNNYSFNCPSDDASHKGGDINNKLNYSTENNLFYCWVYGYGGHVSRLVKEYGREYLTELIDQLEGEGDSNVQELLKQYYEVRLPSNTTKITSENSKVLYDYLKGRGFSDDCIDYYNFSFSEENYYKSKVIIPSYGADNRLNYYCLNDYLHKSTKYSYATYYDTLLKKNISIPKTDRILNESNINWNSPLFIFEGAMDAYSLYPYTNVTYTYGKVIQEVLMDKIKRNKTPTFIVYDEGDTKAQENAVNYVLELQNNNVISDNIKIKNFKDYNEYSKNNNNKYEVFSRCISEKFN